MSKLCTQVSTFICKPLWFCERLTWNPAESPVCDASRQLNVLHQAAPCFTCYDIRNIAIHVAENSSTAHDRFRSSCGSSGRRSSLKTPKTRDLAEFQMSLSQNQICLQMSENISLTENRGLRLPDEPQERRNQSFQTTLTVQDIDKYTHFQINLIFIGNSTESLIYAIVQLNVLHKGISVSTMLEISQYIFIRETTYKVAENSSTAHNRFRSSSAVHIQWPCRDLNPGHLTCEASVLPLLHQRTLDASEFSRLNRRTCSHLSDVSPTHRTTTHLKYMRTDRDESAKLRCSDCQHSWLAKYLTHSCYPSDMSTSFKNIRLTETRGLRLPDEPELEGRNRSWAVEEFSATL
ncbi:hypothetical protein CSKR_105418 [Clonorchis sinensis]|uniref:Uncharacterized protein n=1 Tax=Clonorchis sinensis TaxID=79923 RepID=A0A3R7D348_CLOSI|nr:hypothetical protein CSKR_105418 [Clonorchis sinensis]